MKNKKKKVCFFLGFLLFSLFFTGCHKSEGRTVKESESKSEERTKLVIAYKTNAADYPEDQKLVEEALKEKIREKLNVDVEFVVRSNDYVKEIRDMMASNQQLDIVFYYSGLFRELLMNDNWVPLNRLLQNYGQGILDAVGKDVRDACRIDGELYGLPNNHDFAVGWDGYILRKDILDKYGIKKEDITSMEKLEQIFALVHRKEPQLTILDCSGTSIMTNQYLGSEVFEQIGVLKNYGQEDTFVNVFKTEEYKRQLERIYKWRKLGYIKKDLLSDTENGDIKMMKGNLFAYAFRGKPGVEWQEKMTTGQDVVYVQFGENSVPANAPARFGWGITKHTVSQEKSMELLNLLYTDPELMNLLAYGVEGVHYVKMADGHITFPEGKNTNPFIGEAWRFLNQFITYVWEGNDLDFWDNMKKYNEESIHGNDYGFYFDIMPVYDEYMEIVEIYSKYRVILENGMVDPQEGLEAMNQELDACHIDEVIAEKQRQFDRWKGK